MPAVFSVRSSVLAEPRSFPNYSCLPAFLTEWIHQPPLSLKGKKLKIFCGTPSYMAPEIVTRKEYTGFCADVWAMGVLLHALLCGSFPFKGQRVFTRQFYVWDWEISVVEFTVPLTRLFRVKCSPSAQDHGVQARTTENCTEKSCGASLTSPTLSLSALGSSWSGSLPRTWLRMCLSCSSDT